MQDKINMKPWQWWKLKWHNEWSYIHVETITDQWFTYKSNPSIDNSYLSIRDEKFISRSDFVLYNSALAKDVYVSKIFDNIFNIIVKVFKFFISLLKSFSWAIVHLIKA